MILALNVFYRRAFHLLLVAWVLDHVKTKSDHVFFFRVGVSHYGGDQNVPTLGSGILRDWISCEMERVIDSVR